MDEITPHPDWLALSGQRDALLSQIAALIAELHSMDDAMPVILGRYAAAFGSRLEALHALQIEGSKLKREIDLIQADINAGGEIDFERIQATLDAEFAAWEAKLREEAAMFANHVEILDRLQKPEKVRKLRDKFRILARRLHPDLHPGQSAADLALWHRVTAAYERSNLDELSALEIITTENKHVKSSDTVEALRDQLAMLRVRLNQIVLSIDQRGREWPFDQLAILDDPHALAEHQLDLDTRISEATKLRDQRKQWLASLLDFPAP
jgi:hypothetical protein